MATQTKIIISAEDKTKAALASVKSSLLGISKEGAAVSASFLGLTGVLSGAGLLAFAKKGIDAADALNDLATRTGVTVEQLASFELIARTSDTSLESLGKGLNKLSVFMANNAEESRKLGITAKDPIEAFLQLSDLVSNLTSVQDRNAIAQRVLGKSYEDLLPVLVQGGAALREQVNQSKEYAKTMADAAPKAALFNDKLDELKLRSDALSIAFGNKLLDNINDISSAMSTAADEANILTALFVGLGGLGDLVFNGTKVNQATKEVEKYTAEVERLEKIKNNTKLNKPLAAQFFETLNKNYEREFEITQAKNLKNIEIAQKKLADAKKNLDALTNPPAAKKTEVKQTKEQAEAAAKAKAILEKEEREKAAKEAEAEAKRRANEAKADAKRRANEAKAEAKRLADEAKREAEALQKAELSLQETLRSNAAKFTEAQITAQADATRREYDAKLITAEQYYARLNVLEEQRTQNQLRLLNQNLADQQAILNSNAAESEKTRARAEISNINTEISLVQTNLQNLKAQAASDLATAQTDQLKTNFDAVKTQIDNALQDLRRREDQINNRVGLGLPEIAAEQQVNAVRRETVQTVTALVQQLEAMAEANPKAFGADAARTIEDYKARLQETTVVIDVMAVRINSELNNGFSTFFNDVITGTESVSEAFRKMLLNITNAIAQEASRQLGQQLFKSIFGESVGAGGGFGSILSGLFGGGSGFFGGATGGPLGFAEGGYTGDGGKYQPKGIVHGGEFVFSKAATQNLGVGALAHLHALASGSFLPQGRRTSYAAGGLVDLPATAGNATVSNTNIIAIDQSDVQNAAFGGGADKKILNIVNVNRAAFRSALGV